MDLSRSEGVLDMSWMDDNKATVEYIAPEMTAMDTSLDIELFEVARLFGMDLKDIDESSEKLNYIKEWALSQYDSEVPERSFKDIIRNEKIMLGADPSVRDFWVYLKLQEDISKLQAKVEGMKNGRK